MHLSFELNCTKGTLVFNQERFNELRLYIKALEPLPFQLKASRRARWDAAERQSRTPTGVKPEDVVRLPYRKYAPPIVNLNHNVFYNNLINALGYSGS